MRGIKAYERTVSDLLPFWGVDLLFFQWFRDKKWWLNWDGGRSSEASGLGQRFAGSWAFSGTWASGYVILLCVLWLVSEFCPGTCNNRAEAEFFLLVGIFLINSVGPEKNWRLNGIRILQFLKRRSISYFQSSFLRAPLPSPVSNPVSQANLNLNLNVSRVARGGKRKRERGFAVVFKIPIILQILHCSLALCTSHLPYPVFTGRLNVPTSVGRPAGVFARV